MKKFLSGVPPAQLSIRFHRDQWRGMQCLLLWPQPRERQRSIHM